MKKKDLTKQQQEELEKFGANTWFVEYLYRQYKDDPSKVPQQWRHFSEM
jgi:2-oxoglutarate dehydrogenase complex dehydrogenase (E1) component-like enzyme